MIASRAALVIAGLLLAARWLPAAEVKVGIDVLEARGFAELKGKRVGLITNATGIDSQGNSTVDILRQAPGVKLVALFGPEHGVYGSDWAGQYVASSTDAHTGLPVYSLYGPTRKPTPEMLKGIDALVYDIQDIGCRSYTFVSTMGLAMEAANEEGIKFYVLDRPNPLNGNRVEGMMLDPGFRSFTCQWDIPYVYGMTPGELAYMIRSTPGWISKAQHFTKEQGSPLTIVPMEGWYRSMYWEDTGLIWIPTSPHIPTSETALNYVATGFLGEAGGINHGIGYTLPFAVFGHPSFDSFALADQFNQMHMPGLVFRPVTFKPFYGAFKDQLINGAQIYYTDRDKVNLCNLAVQILYRMYHAPGTKMFRNSADGDSGPDAFDHIARTDALRLALQSGKTPEDIITSWQPGLAAFREVRRPFLLYGERPKSETGN
ncbi:MAG TPA: DUF1343 domain-containing protein [Candidatus Methylacidiphilales bacterium]